MKMPGYYMLAGHDVVPCIDVATWASYFETAKRNIGQAHVRGMWVSTVFLGLDHGFSMEPGAAPVLFETMIFKGWHESTLMPGRRLQNDVFCERYTTWAIAHTMHKAIVRQLRLSRRQQRTRARTRCSPLPLEMYGATA